MRNRLHSLLASLLLAPAFLAAAPSPNVRVNSIGFVPGLAKKATVLGAASNAAFNVRRLSDNSSAFAGTLSTNIYSAETGETLTAATFDGLTENGTFYLDVSGVGQSVTFTVSPLAYNNSLWLNLMGFYNQRCGMATSMSVGSVTWGHGACHLGDANTVNFNGINAIKDATGGWHDAGDFNKYIVNAAAAVGPLLHAWERHSDKLSQLSLPSGTNAGLPDYLEELKWELDWVKKMQFPDGRVSDKITVWGGFEPFIMPDLHTAQRYFAGWGTAQIAAFTGMLACAARLYQPYDPAYAASLLSAAALSYGHLTTTATNTTANIAGTPQGNYTGSNANNMRLWAYVEYFETTGDTGALALAEARITALADKSAQNFDWPDLGNLGTYTYVLSSRAGRNSTLVNQCRSAILTDASSIVAQANGHPYGRGMGNYYWGSNGTVARLAYTLDAANLISPNNAYLSAIQDQASWIYGRNTYTRSFVTGDGYQPPLYPHDRESATDGINPPKPGHLVGGSDSCGTCWQDDESKANLNEIAINWDAGMAYALTVLSGYPLGTPTPTPTASATPTPSPDWTATVSPTPSPSATITPDWTHTATPTVTPTATFSPTVTASPTPGLVERPGILGWKPVPHPALGPLMKVAVELNGGADGLELRLYSANYARAATLQASNPPFASGWNRAYFDISVLPPGMYFGVLLASTGSGPQDKSSPQRVYILR